MFPHTIWKYPLWTYPIWEGSKDSKRNSLWSWPGGWQIIWQDTIFCQRQERIRIPITTTGYCTFLRHSSFLKGSGGESMTALSNHTHSHMNATSTTRSEINWNRQSISQWQYSTSAPWSMSLNSTLTLAAWPCRAKCSKEHGGERLPTSGCSPGRQSILQL